MPSSTTHSRETLDVDGHESKALVEQGVQVVPMWRKYELFPRPDIFWPIWAELQLVTDLSRDGKESGPGPDLQETHLVGNPLDV